VSGQRNCPLCQARPATIGWCGGCRQSYRAQGIARANVMAVAEWGASRRAHGKRQMERFERTLRRAFGKSEDGKASG
jgi:hypothetical protein